MVGIHDMLVKIANTEDPDQNLGLHCFWQATKLVFEILEHPPLSIQAEKALKSYWKSAGTPAYTV